MPERDAETEGGIPPDGVPSSEAVRQEREQWDEEKTVKERIYETALTLREPTTVSAVADRTRCTPESARRHLLWFADIGIVEPVGEGQPAQFQRNLAYFRWKRANEARRSHSSDELAARLETLLEHDRAYQEKYDAADPAQVSAFDIAEPDDHDTLETIWSDINDWLTVREDQRVLEHAQRLQREQQSAPA
jgi:predicted ArsR family transcriptional regulator